MSTSAVYKALRQKYAAPKYAFITEVGDATGFSCKRYADAIAMGVWPSRGMELEGIEVKSSRTDWLKELENPAKAESICRFCDRWWLAVSADGIVGTGELPPTWGLMVLSGDKLRIVTPAPKLEPLPVSRGFLASLLRKSVEQSFDDCARKKTYQEGYDAGVKVCTEIQEKRLERELKNHMKTADDLRATIKDFEDKSGVRLSSYDRGRIGVAVQRVLRGETPPEVVASVLERLEYATRVVREIKTEWVGRDR